MEPETIALHMAQNLKFLRTRKKASQADVADAIGAKRSSYSGYENGIAEPNLKTTIQLSRYFRIPITKLLQQDLRMLRELELRVIEHEFNTTERP